MKFGVCTGFENAGLLKDAGFDYIELSVQGALVPEKSEAEFQPFFKQLKSLPLPVLAANCFLPGHLKVTGPEVDERKQARYVENACGRAMRCGIEKLVFGSGGAKQIPEGFSRERAQEQLVEFGKMAAHIASACGVTIVVEPLNKVECNVITSVGEGLDYVKQVDSPSFKLLVDLFHFMKDDNDLTSLAKASPYLVHAHIATKPGRKAPGLEPTDFSKEIKVLKNGGYDSTISIEGGWNDIAKEASLALKELRSAVNS